MFFIFLLMDKTFPLYKEAPGFRRAFVLSSSQSLDAIIMKIVIHVFREQMGVARCYIDIRMSQNLYRRFQRPSLTKILRGKGMAENARAYFLGLAGIGQDAAFDQNLYPTPFKFLPITFSSSPACTVLPGSPVTRCNLDYAPEFYTRPGQFCRPETPG